MNTANPNVENYFENYLATYVESDNTGNIGDGDDNDDGNILIESLKQIVSNCQYFDLEELTASVEYNFKYTSIHINIHSLPSKHDQLVTLLANLHDNGIQINFIMLCETFLTDINFNKYPIPGYQFIQTNRTNSRGGGVGIYIMDTLQFIERPDLSINILSEFESIFIEITNLNIKLVIGEIYRIPNTNEQASIARYEAILQKFNNFNGDVIIGTDQNFNYINTNTHMNTSQLLNTFIAAGFLPTITKPTRITQNSATLIDNIYIKLKSLQNLSCGIINIQISDHLPIFMFTGKQAAHKHQLTTITCRPIDDTAINQIEQYLNNINWTEMEHLTTDHATCYLTSQILNALNVCAPEKTIKLSAKNKLRQPWMTTALLKSSKTKDKLFKHCLNKPADNEKRIKFTEYRNTYNRLKRLSKQNYYTTQLEKYKFDSKNTWSVLNNLIGKNNNKTPIPDKFKLENGNSICNPKIISNEFCKYFTEIGNKFASKIPKPKRPFNEYLNHRHNQSIFLIPTDPEEIQKTIASLKPKNSYGHDQISSKLLKTISTSIKYPLSIIVNKSLSTGYVPTSMKLARIIPIYKAKDKSQMSNYRPISLLPSLSKI